MIRLLALALCVFSFNAHATPKVGDSAVYIVKLGLNGQSAEATNQVELVQFDLSKNAYLERQTFTLQGRAPETADNWKATDEFMNDATIDEALSNCQANGGLSQKVYVPAGEFATCALNFDAPEASGVVWVGKAPFGVIKSEIVRKDNGMTISSTLHSFK